MSEKRKSTKCTIACSGKKISWAKSLAILKLKSKGWILKCRLWKPKWTFSRAKKCIWPNRLKGYRPKWHNPNLQRNPHNNFKPFTRVCVKSSNNSIVLSKTTSNITLLYQTRTVKTNSDYNNCNNAWYKMTKIGAIGSKARIFSLRR